MEAVIFESHSHRREEWRKVCAKWSLRLKTQKLYYTIEHALGMSANFKQAERLKTRRGIVKELKETPQFHIAVLEFDE
mgnify:CR=1 FL=1